MGARLREEWVVVVVCGGRSYLWVEGVVWVGGGRGRGGRWLAIRRSQLGDNLDVERKGEQRQGQEGSIYNWLEHIYSCCTLYSDV